MKSSFFNSDRITDISDRPNGWIKDTRFVEFYSSRTNKCLIHLYVYHTFIWEVKAFIENVMCFGDKLWFMLNKLRKKLMSILHHMQFTVKLLVRNM